MPGDAPQTDRERLLLRAAEDILLPLAGLCVAQGLAFARVEEVFKKAYVRAARDARRKAGAPAHRDVSQVAVATGLNRRDVMRITAELKPRAVQRMSPATQVFTEWVTHPDYRHTNGRLRRLARQGPAPSFESLAASVTKHVHARSLLNELLRLGLAQWDERRDVVVLQRDRVVPALDEERLFGFLGANVGDHLAAATENVLTRERKHVEQALFSNALSQASMPAAKAMVEKEWREILSRMVPALEQLIVQDRTANRPATQRLRVGFYSFNEALPDPPPDAPAGAAGKPAA